MIPFSICVSVLLAPIPAPIPEKWPKMAKDSESRFIWNRIRHSPRTQKTVLVDRDLQAQQQQTWFTIFDPQYLVGPRVTCARVIAGMQYLERRGIRVQVLDLEKNNIRSSTCTLMTDITTYRVFSDIWSTFGWSQMSQSVLDILKIY